MVERTNQSGRENVQKIINPPTSHQPPASEKQGDSFRVQTTTDRNGRNNIMAMRTPIERYLNRNMNFLNEHEQTREETNQSKWGSAQGATTPQKQTQLPTPGNQDDSCQLGPTTNRSGQSFVTKMRTPTKCYPIRNMNSRTKQGQAMEEANRSERRYVAKTATRREMS